MATELAGFPITAVCLRFLKDTQVSLPSLLPGSYKVHGYQAEELALFTMTGLIGELVGKGKAQVVSENVPVHGYYNLQLLNGLVFCTNKLGWYTPHKKIILNDVVPIIATDALLKNSKYFIKFAKTNPSSLLTYTVHGGDDMVVTNPKFMDYVGTFSIPMDTIRNQPDRVLLIMSDVIVIRAELMAVTNVVEYFALSLQFEPVPDGHKPPEYVPIIEENDSVKFVKEVP